MSTVSLIKGNSRFENVLQALEGAGDEVADKVHGNVIIKVNTVMHGGEASRDPMTLFRENDYFKLKDEYSFEFIDFNTLGYDDFQTISIDNQPIHAKITRHTKSLIVSSHCRCRRPTVT